ncbi:MAG: amidohydrolase family protein [Lentisphaeria bacterium]|nr:amidohydrolase family protein [Lentisphaeria bacterium]NQZ67188.1 amidohydrolase family protein [Lentisphaeria bacterium]
MQYRIKNIKIVTALEILAQDILLSSGKFEAFIAKDSPAPDYDEIDGADCFAYPGMLDLLSHGFGDHQYSDCENTCISDNSKELLSFGVTGFCPSIISSVLEVHLKRINSLAKLSESATGARVLGIHSEGPCMASSGIHPKESLQIPSLELAEQLLEAGLGKLKIVTLSPELDGAEAFVQQLTKNGVSCHLGHSNVPPEAVSSVIDFGINAVTHMFNVMLPGTVKIAGVTPASQVEAVIADKRICMGIICDGVHNEKMRIKMLCQLAKERVFLETDSMKFSGRPAGRFEIAPGVFVNTAGEAAFDDTGILAGSILTSDQALRNFLKWGDGDLVRASWATSLNPARLINSENDIGSIAVGKSADFILLDKEYHVQKTFLEGALVYDKI